MDLPKILLTGLFFLLFCFYLFSSSFWTIGLGRAKHLEKNRKTKKKQTILHGLTQDSSHRIVFFFFFWVFLVFIRVFGQLGLGEQKTSRKTKKKQFCMDLPKILLTGLVFLFFFFWFSSSFWTIGLGRAKNLEKKQKKQFCMDLPKILSTGLVFLFFFGFP